MDRMRNLVVLGVALGVIESLALPASWPLKPGLANIATLYAATMGLRAAVIVAMTRSLLVCMATGTLLAPSGIFSLAGGLASAVVMAGLCRLPISLVLISVMGGAVSSMVQVGVFGLVSGVPLDGVRTFLPWFAAWGAGAGLVTGLLGSRFLLMRSPCPAKPLCNNGIEMVQNQCAFRFDTVHPA